MNEFEFQLFDRIEKIKQINEQYNLLDNAYLSFSGGKDSTVLHYLLDAALPNNNIPRIYLNTGIEYNDVRKFVVELSMKDPRIIVVNSNVNIKGMLEKKGYPFKSKEHAKKIGLYQCGSTCKGVNNYLDIDRETRYKCPKILRCQLSLYYPLKISDKCCHELKKKVAQGYEKENNKSIVLTGMRNEEGGQRASIGCIVTKGEKLKKFHPLLPLNEDWLDFFIEKYNIKLCKLYYPPYNFKRTGCKGCPFSLDLQSQLQTMYELMPNEYYQTIKIWKPVYDEYIRLGYRLKYYPHNIITLFDFI